MVLASKPLTRLINAHPTAIILCLGFLLMIGFALLAEGFGFHVPKGYLYAAIIFAVLIEILNQVARRNLMKIGGRRPLRERTAEGILRMLGKRQATEDAPQEGEPAAEAAGAFGRALAATHRAGAPCFGAADEGYIGRLPLLNRSLPTWAEFWAERRIAPYLKVLRDKDMVTAEEAATIEAAAAKGGEIVPEEPPARLHGDLWNGNVLWAADDRVVVIDPAAHGGHREVDLAMLALFGLPQLPQVMDRIGSVTLDEVQSVARQVFSKPEILAVVGPA